MTQKELLYVEDAIMHEKNIISICEDMVLKLEEKELISFIKKEIKKHNTLLEKMMKKLEDLAND